jgi:hypothetical protein
MLYNLLLRAHGTWHVSGVAFCRAELIYTTPHEAEAEVTPKRHRDTDYDQETCQRATVGSPLPMAF